MFIKTSQSGCNRYGEQFARGSFLVVFSHNKFKAEEQANPPVLSPAWYPCYQGKERHTCSCAGNPSYYQKSCPVHKDSYVIPKVDGRKLYACVRHTSLRQWGHWMMGTVKIAGQSVTVSGSYGGDGLPRDYEDLTPAARSKLTEVPAALTEEFWNGGGHNCAGNEAPAMRKWALTLTNK